MVVDATLLFNELDLLELRLNELDPVVDRFVIVESNRTHKGTLKPLYYAESKARFAAFEDKIVHIVCPLADDGDGLPAIRRREMTQRNAILQGIRDCADDDIVLISDCDEIPRSHCVVKQLDDGMVVTYLQKLYYYNFNTYAPDRVWPGTRACRVSDARALSPHVIRNGLGQPDTIYPIHRHIGDAGWHYSYFGGVVAIHNKMTEFLHQELVTDENITARAIGEKVARGVDVWGRPHEQDFVIGAADDLPYTVLRDLPQWTQHFAEGWKPEFHENWYSGAQALYVGQLARQAPEGAIVEIGCWEGRSITVTAQLINPRIIHAVDHWRGNLTEGESNPSILAARDRDVYATFHHNIECLNGNVQVHCADWKDWIRDWDQPIAFLHLDASHDYQSVLDCLIAIKPFLVSGAIACGDDAYADEVWRGACDAFGSGVEKIGERLWLWHQDADNA